MIDCPPAGGDSEMIDCPHAVDDPDIDLNDGFLDYHACMDQFDQDFEDAFVRLWGFEWHQSQHNVGWK